MVIQTVKNSSTFKRTNFGYADVLGQTPGSRWLSIPAFSQRISTKRRSTSLLNTDVERPAKRFFGVSGICESRVLEGAKEKTLPSSSWQVINKLTFAEELVPVIIASWPYISVRLYDLLFARHRLVASVNKARNSTLDVTQCGHQAKNFIKSKHRFWKGK